MRHDDTHRQVLPYQQVLRYAITRLTKREYATRELREKLVHYVIKHQYNDIDGTCIDQMLCHLQAEGLLSDQRYAESIVRYYGNRLSSNAVIRRLRTKGVPEDVIATHRTSLKNNELKTAYQVWQKKFDTLPTDDRMRRQQIQYLLRRGFSSDTIDRLFDSIYCDDLSELT